MDDAGLKPIEALSPGTVLTKAVMRAGHRLQLTNRVLAKIIGVSEATVSRMSAGEYVLSDGQKPFELGALFVRFYRSLDALIGGDDSISAQWLRSDNVALGGEPLEKIQSLQGLIDVIQYLDARRAIV
jgi:hypothetical protein